MANNTSVPRLRFPEFRGSAGWEEKKLGEVGKFIGGGTPDTTTIKFWDGPIQWFTPTEIKGRYLKNSVRSITEEGLKNSSAKMLPKGTLLITTRATIGEIGIAEKQCTTNQGFQSLLVNEDQVNIFWYYWIIQHKHELERRSSGSTFPEISKTEIVKIDSLSPTLPEQQKIADCLSSLDDLIAAESAKLQALGVHKKGLLQGLFPAGGETVPRLRFSEFAGSGDWEEKMLGEVCFKISDGIHSTPKYDIDGAYYFINGNNLINGNISVDENTKRVSEQEYKLHQKDLGENSILLSINGTIGNLAQYKNEKVVLGKSACYINIDKSKSNIDFIYNYLQTEVVKNYFELELTGSTIKNLSLKTIKNSLLGFPTLPEQQKIADCLSSLDALLAAQQLRIAALQRHKRGLMQQLFPAAL